MPEKKIDGAILKEDGCLYCPDCNKRIAIRDPRPYGAMEKRVVLYGKCQCPEQINKEWNFEYWIPEAMED